MAITNAQQYKQLVNPPMKGNKRPGYRGEVVAPIKVELIDQDRCRIMQKQKKNYGVDRSRDGS